MTTYAVLKFAHVLGAVALVGNVVITGVWSVLLLRDPSRVPRSAIARGIWWSDVWFTLGGGAMLAVTGVALAFVGDLPLLHTPWIVRGIIALAASTSVWLVVLIPLQRRMLAARDDEAFRHAYRRWNAFGWGATAPLLWAIWEMVAKRA